MGWTKIAKLLIKMGADVNAKNKNGTTPLHFAALKDRIDVVKLLIKNKADVNAINKDDITLLHCAAYSGKIETMEFLIKMESDVNAANFTDITPIRMAASYGQLAAVQFLIQQKVDINVENINGYKPIHLAMINGYTKIVELLSKQPANKVNAKELFSVEKCSNAKALAQEYRNLFIHVIKNKFNNIIPKYISKTPLLNKIFKKNTKCSYDISKGLCLLFANLVSFLNLNKKEDFDELYSLINYFNKKKIK